MTPKQKQDIINVIKSQYPEILTPAQAIEVKKLIRQALNQKKEKTLKDFIENDLKKPDYFMFTRKQSTS
jgi:hypothetical protein